MFAPCFREDTCSHKRLYSVPVLPAPSLLSPWPFMSHPAHQKPLGVSIMNPPPSFKMFLLDPACPETARRHIHPCCLPATRQTGFVCIADRNTPPSGDNILRDEPTQQNCERAECPCSVLSAVMFFLDPVNHKTGIL